MFLLNANRGFNNTVNAMMDHIWDTFYTGQRRMARFPTALETDQDYRLEFSGTPPKKMRFNLDALTGAVKIKIPYPVAGSIQVYANGKKVDYTPWDESINRHGPLTKMKGCGENRFVGIDNFLEFYLTTGCLIEIEPKDAIMTKVRMNWSLDEFYSDGGTTRFVDRLAASLGIDANRVKVVAIYEGSTVVDFVIEADEETSSSSSSSTTSSAAALTELSELTQKLVEQVNAGELDIGAPVMGIQGDDGSVLAGDPIPEPKASDFADSGDDSGDSTSTSSGSTFTDPSTLTFEGDGNSAIVGEDNLWDGLEIVPEYVPPVVEEEAEPEPTPEPEPVVEEEE